MTQTPNIDLNDLKRGRRMGGLNLEIMCEQSHFQPFGADVQKKKKDILDFKT